MSNENKKTDLQLSTNLKLVLARARSVARNWCHNCVGPEHIMFEIMANGSSDQGYAYRITSSILYSNKRNGFDLIQALESTHGRGPVDGAHTNIPCTPRTNKILGMAKEESASLSHDVVCTLHFLLATLKDGRNNASRVLSEFGITYDSVLAEFLKQSSGAQVPPNKQSTPARSEIVGQNTGANTLEHFNQLTRILDTDFNKLPAIVRVAGDNLKKAALIALHERSWFNREYNVQDLIYQLSLKTSLWLGLDGEDILKTIANIFRDLGDSAIKSLHTAFDETSVGSIQERRIGIVLQLATDAKSLTKTLVINFIPSPTP